MTNKMIEVEKLTEDEVKKRLNDLIDLDDYRDACATCRLLGLLQRGNKCMRSNCVKMEEECHVSQKNRENIKPKVLWIKRARNVET